jgi:hypothetical protein
MTKTVKLIKRDKVWVTELLGRERNFRLEHDGDYRWRSLGVIPGTAVEFECDSCGNLIDVVNLSTGQSVDGVIELSNVHPVAMMMSVTTPVRIEEATC